jgi:MinD superfamily P-loop ATPase
MMDILKINNICICCDNCRIVCPESAVINNGKNYAIETWSCTLCQLCVVACPVDAIKLEERKKEIAD